MISLNGSLLLYLIRFTYFTVFRKAKMPFQRCHFILKPDKLFTISSQVLRYRIQ